ncbi:MAG: tRNA (N6-isopentenyl adenosine(37)-C2)-methylthiotransferase MiaB [Massilioclostridium sp.]|nr:tRNA (N6-isopentenyl adenosine(37)-C2)-methylthiotransferase MiaB [Massilioclostridium sp.]
MSQTKPFEIPCAELEQQELFAGKVLALNEDHLRKTGRRRLACTRTYGCQANVADGEKIRGILHEIGYEFTDEPDEADFILFNTCAVRENAEDRVFGNIGALAHLKKENPNLIIAVCGCMMQQEHIVEKIRKSYPYVGLVFGTHVVHRLPELVYRARTEHKRVFDSTQSDGVIAEDLPVVREEGSKAWLPIMYGCNNFCTYCIVPYVRGRERSREPDAILREARQLVADGYKEITLLGQNVNSYGKNLPQPIRFSQLLRMINDIPGDFRIRFMTSHPKDATRELIDTIADCDKVCNHLHLPVQCGSDEILRRMNRGYTCEQYLELVEYAKKRIPGLSLSSDIIVGFPGETYENFQGTLKLIEAVGYDLLYTFIYSKRVGTKAANYDDPVDPKEKSRWFRELLEVQAKIGRANFEGYVGQTARVLVDGTGKKEGMLTGRDEHNILVEFEGPPALIGSFADVKITQAHQAALVGSLKAPQDTEAEHNPRPSDSSADRIQ